VPLARDMPWAFEIATASQSFYFRAANKRDQQEWLAALKEGVEIATENELFEFAELIITDETRRRNERKEAEDAEAQGSDTDGAF